jgi:hypothetical protein
VLDVRAAAGTDADKLADSYALEGDIDLRLHNAASAMGAFEEAYRINFAATHLMTAAGIAEALGDRAHAIWAYGELCDHDPAGDACKKRNLLLAPR